MTTVRILSMAAAALLAAVPIQSAVAQQQGASAATTTEIYTQGYTLSLHDALPIWLGFQAGLQIPGESYDNCESSEHGGRCEIGRAHV